MTAYQISRRWLWILLLIAMLPCWARIGRSSDDDAPVDADAANGIEPPLINNAALLRIKKGISSVPRRSQLAELLSWKIDEIDLVSDTTDGEKEKLRLSGQGDIKRFLDRVHELQTSLQSATDPPDIDSVAREWDSLKRLAKSGIFEEGSLFSKARRRILTSEQLAKLKTEAAQTGEAFSIIGVVDLDGDGQDDRDELRKVLAAYHAVVDNDVDGTGILRVNGKVHDKPRFTQRTKFVVIGKIPDAVDTDDAERIAAIQNIHRLRNHIVGAARDRGIRVISLNDFLRYVGPKKKP